MLVTLFKKELQNSEVDLWPPSILSTATILAISRGGGKKKAIFDCHFMALLYSLAVGEMFGSVPDR